MGIYIAGVHHQLRRRKDQLKIDRIVICEDDHSISAGYLIIIQIVQSPKATSIEAQ